MEKLIELLQYIFLGAVQGISETLPISSSGHLVIMQRLVGLEADDNLTFEILLHFGSLIAIVIFYYDVIIELARNFFRYLLTLVKSYATYLITRDKDQLVKSLKKEEDKLVDFKYTWLIVIATIPAGLFGYFYSDWIAAKLTSLLTVGISLLFTALVLYIISKMPKGHKDKYDVTVKDAIFIGLIQALAIIPGISRSGSTVSMSLYRKLNIDNALRFSFLLFIPVALGAALIDVVKLIQSPNVGEIAIPYLVAFLTSILFTFISLRIFIDILKKGKLIYFSYYCIFAGITSLALYFII